MLPCPYLRTLVTNYGAPGKVSVQHHSEEISLAHRNEEGLEATREMGTGRGVGLTGRAKETVRVTSFFTGPTSSP